MLASIIVPTIIISKNVQQSPINKEVKEIFNSVFGALPSDLSKTKNGPLLFSMTAGAISFGATVFIARSLLEARKNYIRRK